MGPWWGVPVIFFWENVTSITCFPKFFRIDYISRETNDIFLVECPGGKRTRPVLEHIIVNHVKEGSHIITDGWAAYRHLEEKGFLFLNTVFLLPKFGNTA